MGKIKEILVPDCYRCISKVLPVNLYVIINKKLQNLILVNNLKFCVQDKVSYDLVQLTKRGNTNMTMEAIHKTKKSCLEYKIDDISCSGTVIKKILRNNSNVIVFRDETNSLCWEVLSIKQEIENLAGAKCFELMEKIPDELDKRTKNNLKNLIASSLFHALNKTNKEDVLNSFKSIENRIKNIKTPYEIKSMFFILYVFITSVICLIAICTVSKLDNDIKLLITCCSSGAVGSLFSVLQRNTEFKLSDKESYIALQAIFNNILGVLSGATVYFASKAQIAFSFAHDNIYMLTIFAMVAGFSERMIPELFKSVENNNIDSFNNNDK